MTVSVYEDYPYPEDISYICAQVAEVEVEPETGAVQVHRIMSAHNVGTIINPISHQNQIDNATIINMDQKIIEELIMKNNRITNANLNDYKLPTTADIPELKTVLVKSGNDMDPLDSKPI